MIELRIENRNALKLDLINYYMIDQIYDHELIQYPISHLISNKTRPIVHNIISRSRKCIPSAVGL